MSKMDPELVAMQRVTKILATLDTEAQNRVLLYAQNKIWAGEKKRMAEQYKVKQSIHALRGGLDGTLTPTGSNGGGVPATEAVGLHPDELA